MAAVFAKMRTEARSPLAYWSTSPHLRHLVQYRVGMVCQHFSGLRWCYAAAPAIEQGHFLRCFHVAEPFTGRWKGQAYFSTMGDAPGIHHREKQAKVSQVEAHASLLTCFLPSLQP